MRSNMIWAGNCIEVRCTCVLMQIGTDSVLTLGTDSVPRLGTDSVPRLGTDCVSTFTNFVASAFECVLKAGTDFVLRSGDGIRTHNNETCFGYENRPRFEGRISSQVWGRFCIRALGVESVCALLLESPRDSFSGGAALLRRGIVRASRKAVGWNKFGIRKRIEFEPERNFSDSECICVQRIQESIAATRDIASASGAKRNLRRRGRRERYRKRMG